MKKKILSLAIALFAAVGFMASAQTQDNKMYSPRTFTDYAFEGVLLDIPQQQRIDSLHSALRTPSHKKVQAITMAPDSAQAMPGRHGNKKPAIINGCGMGVMPGVEYVAKVKEILTPDQFDIFMSNIQSMPDNAVNNLIATPQGRQNPAMNGKAGKMGERKCPHAQGQQCDKQKDKNCDKACDKNCDKACDKNCDKACDKKCDKACDKNCDKKCDKACDDQKCLNSSDNCAKSNCSPEKAHKSKKSSKKAKKVKK